MNKLLMILALLLPLPLLGSDHCQGSTEELLECEAPRVKQFLKDWGRAWADGDIETYLSMYIPGRSPRPGMERDEWEAHRRARIVPGQNVQIDLKLESMGLEDSGIYDVVFIQHYRADDFQDQVRKRLFLLPDGSDFMIFKEETIQ